MNMMFELLSYKFEI